jgi:hypothetical protein
MVFEGARERYGVLRDRYEAWGRDHPVKALGALVAGFTPIAAVFGLTMAYVVLPAAAEPVKVQQLSQYSGYCSHLESEAQTPETKEFVRNKVTITDGWHRDKTCGQVIDEYSKLEESVQ